ncbi:conserved hypothetical protein [Talaromyces stipitatus ATCC 10500]|uniref:Aminoglycoside phosphotransferase domain-containing protein n=1 Tax=Talaromyces stipitatus (strain ATCC 10500 / CBS 375.48 / QM 6759 / NRRL 1006) TaxID=441959 RepID=B8M0F5_TALSN|nr:uncharacterized protein TSTA_084830 [Talaromyces stipitatus ATCC 10500]EED21252.1 conserved hypothetical protein [Talaromyces stipitatus ATCC 10500]
MDFKDMDLEHKVRTIEDIFKTNIAELFSIGPVVNTAFRAKERANMEIDRGPWVSSLVYIRALALREIAWIQKYAKSRSPNDPLFVSQNLRTPNVFVNDNGDITSVIDWQSTRADPLFLEDHHPHFLDYNGEMTLQLPENFKPLDKDVQTIIKNEVSKSILLYLYEKYTAERGPRLSRVFQYPNGRTLTDPILFMVNTWDRGILLLQESLIRVQRKFKETGIHRALLPSVRSIFPWKKFRDIMRMEKVGMRNRNFRTLYPGIG